MIENENVHDPLKVENDSNYFEDTSAIESDEGDEPIDTNIGLALNNQLLTYDQC